MDVDIVSENSNSCLDFDYRDDHGRDDVNMRPATQVGRRYRHELKLFGPLSLHVIAISHRVNAFGNGFRKRKGCGDLIDDFEGDAEFIGCGLGHWHLDSAPVAIDTVDYFDLRAAAIRCHRDVAGFCASEVVGVRNIHFQRYWLQRVLHFGMVARTTGVWLVKTWRVYLRQYQHVAFHQSLELQI